MISNMYDRAILDLLDSCQGLLCNAFRGREAFDDNSLGCNGSDLQASIEAKSGNEEVKGPTAVAPENSSAENSATEEAGSAGADVSGSIE